jgi:hypothetical protein
MPKPKPPSVLDTLEELLDRVSSTREELFSIEIALERLKADVAKIEKKDSQGRKRNR